MSQHTSRSGGIHDLALFRDMTRVVSVGQDRSVTFWDFRSADPSASVQCQHEPTCISVRWVGRWRRRACAGSLCGPRAAHVQLSSDNRMFVMGGTDLLVRLWSAEKLQELGQGAGHSAVVNSVRFSPDDKQFVSVGDEGAIFVWNVYSGH